MRPILLVEDNQDDVLFFRRAMGKAEITHPLHVAWNGAEAIEYLNKFAGVSNPQEGLRPSLVLLDLQLPHVKGMDVLKWIREQPELRTLIVIIHTSSHLEAEIERAYKLGANSFLVKAPCADQLVHMLKLVKAYWLELNASVGGDLRSSADI
ncbi:MAG: response regulator [Candidatus Methylacidiphilales bacterium]|nr:response regulator [Candidatus Methylacidiphilales bacterium]